MKKILAIAMAAIMLLGLVACAQQSDNGGSRDGYTVYLITMDQMDQHWANVNKGCEKAVEELKADGVNVTYKWTAPQTKDDSKQIELINNAVNDGADAILLAANGPETCIDAVKAAKEAGVKVVYVDSPANEPGEKIFCTDNEAAAKTAGDELLKALTDKGITEGKIGIVNTNRSTQTCIWREEGFMKAFEGTAFELLEVQYSDGDAVKSKDIATNYITEGVVAIYGTNEGCTVGVGNAVAESDKDIIAVGFDKSDAVLALVESGDLLCVMAQNPDQMGYQGMLEAIAILKGEKTGDGATVDTGVSVVTAENAANFK